MTKDECEDLLRSWGRAYGQRRAGDWQEDSSPTGDSPFARVMEFAPGKKDVRIEAAYKRRVRPGERAWSRDPIVCTETRQAIGTTPSSIDDRDPDVELVQAAWFAMVRSDPDMAELVRMEYQVRSSQAEKAEGLDLSKSKYRELLAEARGWIRNHLTP